MNKIIKTQANLHFLKLPIKALNKYKLRYLFLFLSFVSQNLFAQNDKDSLKTDQLFNLHFQNTVISQYHPPIHAEYSGENSLLTGYELCTSVTSTIFMGSKLWKNAEVYFNPEVSGGSGFNQTRGVAGFPNGEIYRINDPLPKVYVARAYIKQLFPLSNDYEKVADDVNQISVKKPTSYISISAGKFSVMDFFDNNTYSHDPRKQFYNWALMGNGAWDYPANMRGYTYGFVAELIKKNWALRFTSVMVPTIANASTMDIDIRHCKSEALEFEHKYTIGKQEGTIRIITFLTNSRMGSYQDAIDFGIKNNTTPDLDSVQSLGKSKYGFGINIEHKVNDNIGLFLRVSWNDGRNQTWMFTDIDRAISGGININGKLWKREADNIGIAQIVNGISQDHIDYLKAGGYSFMIGDGNLNYGLECITEVYYSYKIKKYPVWISPDYQFIVNPAYNKDRGPVNVIGLRVHAEF